MRLVVVGAGAIGGSVGALAIRAGIEVVLVARGAHGEAIRQHGLRLDTPDESFVVHAPLAPDWRDDDIVLLAVKTQDVGAALHGIPRHVPVVCLTNGLAAERIAARAGHPVYGAFVFVPASHLEPGNVQLWAAPVGGVIDVGGYHQAGELVTTISSALQRAGFASEVRDDIIRYKRGKLLMNLGNAIEALCGSFEGEEEIEDRARAEAIACFEAAGLPYTIDPSRSVEVRQIGGKSRPGGSTWQSLARGKPLEVDHFNGEIVALGAGYGIATPTNAVLQRLAAEAVAGGLAAGALPPEVLIAAVERG